MPFERLNLNDTAILVVDHQVGLLDMVGDFDKTVFKNNIIAHAGLAKLFGIPIVLTASGPQSSSFSFLPFSATKLKDSC